MAVKKSKEIVLIADKIDNSGLLILKKSFSVVEYFEQENEILLEKLKKIKPLILIVRSYRKIDHNFIDSLLKFNTVKFICTASSGYDNIDIKYARKHNIKVINVPNGNYVSVAEHTFALILTIFKNITTADQSVKTGQFSESKFFNSELRKKSIGIIGVGRVGSEVAKFARAFNMKVYGNDIRDLQNKYKWIKFVSLTFLLKKCDVITFHVPLNKSTINLLNEVNFTFLKKDCVIINCSRGGVINEMTLLNYLKKGKIKFAGLDVFESEPRINSLFKEMKNVILTPHIAGKTSESRKRMSTLLAKRLVNLYTKMSNRK